MKVCPYCQEEIRNDAAFCNYYGTSQSTSRNVVHKDDSIAWKTFSVLVVLIGLIFVVLFIVFSAPKTSIIPSSPENNLLSEPILPPQASSKPVTYSYSTIQPTPTINYRPITWKELVNFLSDDHTNWNEYIPGKYVCLDFAVDLVANAEKRYIKAWIVGVEFKDGGPGHAFVAFETTDRGIVYIEPQADNYIFIFNGRKATLRRLGGLWLYGYCCIVRISSMPTHPPMLTFSSLNVKGIKVLPVADLHMLDALLAA